jgi:hypothetical protein
MTKQRPEHFQRPHVLGGTYLPTTDDWYPNFERNTVECSLLKLRDGMFRVCIWGADDTGMERDFESQMDAKAMFKALPNPVTRDWLKAQGFVPA